MFDHAADEVATLAAFIHELSDEPLDLRKHPLVAKRLNEIAKKVSTHTTAYVTNGMRAEWMLAEEKNNALLQTLVKDKRQLRKLLTHYTGNRGKALDAFLERRVAGLDLSTRVWKYAEGFKEEMEMALEMGIRDGVDARQLARELKQYLHEPNRLFRRVRNQHGQLRLSQAAAAYHPGRGVYRSSYMNARRLASNEANIAYRTADHDRWQEADYVVGVQVSLSNNHTCKGVKGRFFDICDIMEGKYPKDFKFTGWHVNCRCIATPILKTQEEMDEDFDRILRGEEPKAGSVNEVKRMPPNFNSWMKDNRERIQSAKSLPYFIADNPREAGFAPRYGGKGGNTAEERKKAREEAARIERIKAAIAQTNPKLDVVKLSDEQEMNKLDIKEALGVKNKNAWKGTSSFEAEMLRDTNPKYKQAKGYRDNCQSCVVSFESNVRGCETLPKPYNINRKGQVTIGDNLAAAFMTKDGKSVAMTKIWEHEGALSLKDFLSNIPEDGRYAIGVNYVVNENQFGHAIMALKKGEQIILFDVQSGDLYKWPNGVYCGEFLRVDDKSLNPAIVSDVLMKRG